MTMYYSLINYFNLHYLIAYNVTAACTIVLSFITSKLFVFKDTHPGTKLQAFFYFIIQTSLYFLSNVLLFFLVSVMQINEMLAVVATGIAYSSLNFVLLRFGVFAKSKKHITKVN